MKSRYDLMRCSLQKDSKGNNYPDVLSFDMKNITFDNSAKKVAITQRIAKRPYLLNYDNYGVCYFDDILYWINGVSFVDELVVGEDIVVPEFSDLEKFYTSRAVENEE